MKPRILTIFEYFERNPVVDYQIPKPDVKDGLSCGAFDMI